MLVEHPRREGGRNFHLVQILMWEWSRGITNKSRRYRGWMTHGRGRKEARDIGGRGETINWHNIRGEDWGMSMGF